VDQFKFFIRLVQKNQEFDFSQKNFVQKIQEIHVMLVKKS